MEVVEKKIDKVGLKERYLGFYLDNITDEGLRRKVSQALNSAPDYFWGSKSVPAHAPQDENTHSMLRRTAKSAYYVKGLLQCWELETYKDEMMAASLLHDIGKFEVDPKLHGPKTVEMLRNIWQETHPKLDFVLEVIRLHDGRAWSGVKDLPKMGMILKPEKIGAWLLHTAVVVSSKGKTVFEWS
jgi:hypothetical protein